MIPFDSLEISNWADKPDSQHQLPELIRRLILATVPMPSHLDMPSGSSVSLPGWDGLLETPEGNAWAPYGASAWEFSTQKNTGSKATADYKKRTATPKNVDVPTTTFVFVTPRAWKGKDKWVKDRVKEGHWSNVRALNANDLVTWLGQAPAVAHWFARLIGKFPSVGVTPLDEWWENWSTVANPEISHELVVAGRQDQAERIAQWFRGEPSHYYVQGNTEEEAIAFLAACARSKASQWGPALLARAVVVQTPDAWGSLEGHSSPLVLLRDFSGGNVSPQLAVRRGHHVLTPLAEQQEASGTGVTLSQLGWEETLEALAKMGLSEAKARALARSSARRLPIIRRRLVDESGGPVPEWVTLSTSHSLVALVLVGQWDDDQEVDKAIVAEVVGKPYEEVQRDLTVLMSTPDSPLTKVGSRWRLTSHEEAWHLLSPRLTSTDVERFERIALDVLAAISPEFELPVEERYMAGVLGKVVPHSGTLRAGIARSLALMGTHSDRLKFAEGAPYVPARVVSNILGDDNSWQIWATLSGHLPVLAEASPEAVLNAIEMGLVSDPSPLENMFAQEGDGLFGGVLHTGLLWALGRLAWSRDHFSRVAKILARLAEMDPGGQVSNRPAESLKRLFLPWIRFSEAPDEHRLETLKMLLDTVPKAGWQLLVGIYPSSRVQVTHRYPPSWRPWGQEGAPQPTVGECNVFIGELEGLLLSSVGIDIARWSDLVEIIYRLSPESRQRTIELLSGDIGILRQHPDAGTLWARLRGVLHRHNSYPDKDWAMAAGDLSALESVYLALTPSDPVSAYAWLFGRWPKLHNPPPVDLAQESIDFSLRDNQIVEAQHTAIKAVYETGGVSAILAVAEIADEPRQVGVAVANCLDSALALDLALNHLGSNDLKLRDLSKGILTALFSQSGWKPSDDPLLMAKAIDNPSQALADIYLAAPARRETWDRLVNETPEVCTAYWESLVLPAGGDWDSEELVFAVQQLLSVRRSVDVVKWLALRPMPNQLVVQILEAVTSDLADAGDWAPRVDAFDIAHLFDRLDQSGDVPGDLIAKLEIPYLGMLEYDRLHLAFHREVTKQPRLFADPITWAFQGSDGQAEEAVDDQTRERRATLAFSPVWKHLTLPGLMEDELVDAESLSRWVNEARRLCKERACGDIGDRLIGQVLANAPVGRDGIWPCEPVRDLLDSLSSPLIGIGFVNGKSNLRGVTSRSLVARGQLERSLTDKYLDDSSRVAAKWPFTAQLLGELAAGYRFEANHEDQKADWTDQFES